MKFPTSVWLVIICWDEHRNQAGGFYVEPELIQGNWSLFSIHSDEAGARKS